MDGLRLVHDEDGGGSRLAVGNSSIEIESVQVSIDRAADAISSASLGLTLAADFYIAGEHREACKMALLSTREMLRNVGASQAQMAPFRHLFDALEDLEKGVVDPLLKKAEVQGPRGRPWDPTTTWRARAYAAAGLTILADLGHPLERSAERIVKMLGRLRNSASLSKRTDEDALIGWRKRFVARTAPPSPQYIYDLVLSIARSRPDRGAALVDIIIANAMEPQRI